MRWISETHGSGRSSGVAENQTQQTHARFDVGCQGVMGSPLSCCELLAHALFMGSNPSIILARENWRHRDRLFGMHQSDRLQHLYVIGQTGTGKTTLLQNLVWQDVALGRGVAFFDPHGDAVVELRAPLQARRPSDSLYLDAGAEEPTFGFNPLFDVPEAQHALAANGIVEAFRMIWTGNAWGARLEHLLRNGLLTLVAQPSATLNDLNRLFSDKKYRERCVRRLRHPATIDFWLKEFASYPPRYRVEALTPLWNKLGAFLAQPPLYRILTRRDRLLSPRTILDQGTALFVNLAKGKIGADGASLLGSLMVSNFGVAALSRADQAQHVRSPYFLYLDEFHNFSTLAFASMLSELRKYGLGLTLAHQYLGQLSEEVRLAILGNVGSVMSLRVGAEDARLLQRLFTPEFDAQDLAYLPNHNAYVRLLVHGKATRPFSARTLEPLWRRAG